MYNHVNGLIVVNKERGYTSHDVVAIIRRIAGQKKVGHTGTLDPEAAGVLPVCLGSATKLCDLLTDSDKEYEVDMILGIKTDTQDTAGNVIYRQDVHHITEEDIAEAVAAFRGGYLQVPPMYSAVKINGRKLYELALQGREIERPARRVHIDKIVIETIEPPRVHLKVVCSKGTYIRTLCADIGEKLSCGACAHHILRTRTGGFSLKEATSLSAIQGFKGREELERYVVPMDRLLSDYEKVIVLPQGEKLVKNGNPVSLEKVMISANLSDQQIVRVYQANNALVGLYVYEKDNQIMRPFKMLKNEWGNFNDL